MIEFGKVTDKPVVRKNSKSKDMVERMSQIGIIDDVEAFHLDDVLSSHANRLLSAGTLASDVNRTCYSIEEKYWGMSDRQTRMAFLDHLQGIERNEALSGRPGVRKGDIEAIILSDQMQE